MTAVAAMALRIVIESGYGFLIRNLDMDPVGCFLLFVLFTHTYNIYLCVNVAAGFLSFLALRFLILEWGAGIRAAGNGLLVVSC